MADLRMLYTVTFVRHGGQDQLTFSCPKDAGIFAWWLDHAGAGIEAEITEELSHG